MLPRSAARSSGLDVSLLGVIIAGVAASAGGLAVVPTGTPRLLRFADVGPGYVPVAAMPQDSALLLLLRSAPRAAPPPTGTPSPWTLLLLVGLLLVVAGPLWAWIGRDG